MAAKPEKKAPSRAMTSPVYWVLLGLVIERPSYGLEYYHRYQRVYGDVHPVRSESHIYTALNALRGPGANRGISRGRGRIVSPSRVSGHPVGGPQL